MTIKVADCSTTQLADTAKNQMEYPQPSTQKKGCGFPVMKLAVRRIPVEQMRAALLRARLGEAALGLPGAESD